MALPCLLIAAYIALQEKFPQKPCDKFFIDHACSGLDIGLIFLCVSISIIVLMNPGTVLRFFKWGKVMFGVHSHEWYIFEHLTSTQTFSVCFQSFWPTWCIHQEFGESIGCNWFFQSEQSQLFGALKPGKCFVLNNYSYEYFLHRKTLVLDRFRGPDSNLHVHLYFWEKGMWGIYCM